MQGSERPASPAVAKLVTRPWRAGDRELLRASEPLFSRTTLTRRFLGGTTEFPDFFREALERRGGDDESWLGHVALDGGRLVGLAECAWPAHGDGPPELAVMIADGWQGNGIGVRLVAELLQRCVAAGVRHVEAITRPDNTAAVALARSVVDAFPGRWTMRISRRADLLVLAFTHHDETDAGRREP